MTRPGEAAAFLRLAREELAAAELLRGRHGRQAAFHLQQAAEKLVKAVLALEGLATPRGHQIGALAALLPEEHPWRADLMGLDRLTPFATALRYPTSGGALPAAPGVPELAAHSVRLASLLDELERWSGARRAGG